MGRLALVGKHATLGDPDPAARVPGTEPASFFDFGTHVALYRHGVDDYAPPHAVDHVTHLRVLVGLGCDRILALSSVGSLHADLPVGSVVAPHDFVALDQPPVASTGTFDDHVVPGFSVPWRDRVVTVWRDADPPVVEHGVYWQANGPRFETAAEIRMLAGWADLVGMTVASECVAANQQRLDYAAICIVDNLANGIADQPLTVEEYREGVDANQARLAAALARVVPALAR